MANGSSEGVKLMETPFHHPIKVTSLTSVMALEDGQDDKLFRLEVGDVVRVTGCEFGNERDVPPDLVLEVVRNRQKTRLVVAGNTRVLGASNSLLASFQNALKVFQEMLPRF